MALTTNTRPGSSASASPDRNSPRDRWLRIRWERLRREWPWLVCIAVAGISLGIFSRGIVFERMNGQVEENYQFIAPSQAGRLHRVLVEPGDTVPPGGIVAELDPLPWHDRIQVLLAAQVHDRRTQVINLQRQREKIRKELQGILIQTGGDTSRLDTLPPPDSRSQASRNLLPTLQADAESLLIESAKLRGRIDSATRSIPSLEAQLADIETDIARCQAETDLAVALTPQENPNQLRALFPQDRQMEIQELLDGIGHCKIVSALGGTVNKVTKLPGDYLQPGTSFIEMSGHPAMITAFLPDAEAASLQPGDPVWVTSAHGKKRDIHQTTFVRAAPDAERLPLSSRAGNGAYRAGRRITVAFPPSAVPPGPDGLAGLLPGEGITVYLAHPGDLSFFQKLLRPGGE